MRNLNQELQNSKEIQAEQDAEWYNELEENNDANDYILVVINENVPYNFTGSRNKKLTNC